MKKWNQGGKQRKKMTFLLGVVIYTYKPSTPEADAGGLPCQEFEVSLGYVVSSRLTT